MKSQTKFVVNVTHLHGHCTFLQVFEDPVSTIHGHSYERKAIEKALAVKHVDPLTQSPLTPQQIFPNIAIRHACEEYRKAMAAAKPWWQS